MNDIYILGIETSCDETSVSIVKNGAEEIATVILSQMDTHATFGGVVPEIASRMHVENITLIIEQCLTKANMKIEEINAFAVTYGPGLIGSLLIGTTAASTLSYMYKKPLIPVHHIAGHIYANNLKNEMKFPLIALVVSGGHTELIYMDEHYSFERIGGTLDDAVGEAYDKVARVLKLPYPGGPLVDKLAFEGQISYELPFPLDDNSYNFSFSGLKSAVINLIHNEKQRDREINQADLAATFQDRAIGIITKKTMLSLEEYKVSNLLIAGGVAANKKLRSDLQTLCHEKGYNLMIPEFKYCTDNATMIAAAGYFMYERNEYSGYDLKAKANIPLV